MSDLAAQLRSLADVVDCLEDQDVTVETADPVLTLGADSFRAQLTVSGPTEQLVDDPVSEPSESTDERDVVQDDSDTDREKRLECDVEGCDYVGSEHGLAIHHGTVHDDTDVDDLAEEENDDTDEPVATDEPEEVACDVDSCDYVGTERGLSIHTTRAHDVGEDALEAPTAEEIQALRAAHGWTQAELADELGVGNSSVANWESQGTTPSDEPAEQLRTLLDAIEDETDSRSDEYPDDGDGENEDRGDATRWDGVFPRECTCGTVCEGSLEWAVHRTETHDTPKVELGHLEPGEFEEIVTDADGVDELVDRFDWSTGRTLRLLGIYGLEDVVGGDTDLTHVNDFEFEGIGDSEDDADDEPVEPVERIDVEAEILADVDVDADELLDALEGAQSVHHVHRELPQLTREEIRDVLDRVGILEELERGSAQIDYQTARQAVTGGLR